MWREPRWIAILLMIAMQCECASYAANVQSRRVSTTQNIRVLSATPDQAGNFVLLSTQKSRQLSFPTINYLPATAGRAVMTVDFAGAVFAPEQAVFNFDRSSIKQVRIGQVQAYPPVMRISMLAERADVFGKVDFRSSPGALSIKLPYAVEMQTISEMPKPAPEIVKVKPTPTTAPNAYDKSPPIAPPITMRAAKPAAEAEPVEARSKVSDAQYIPMETKESRPLPLAKWFRKLLPKAEMKKSDSAEPAQVADRTSSVAPNVAPSRDGPAVRAPRAAPPPGEPVKTSADTLMISASGSDPICLTLTASRPFTYNSFRLNAPDRLVIDITGLEQPPATCVPELENNPLARGIRIGSPQGQPEVTRVVVDLVDDHVVVNEAQEAEALTLRLQRSTTATARPTIDPRRIRMDGLIVLDAGHGGSDPGAQRGDVQEKELTMAIVAKLRKQLEKRGLRVRLTRFDDTYISLEDRVKITNATQPDAFVSVHINSLETNNQINGVETYYQNERSKDLAQLIHTSLVTGLNVPDRSVRKARFYVINHTPVPAVLAEVGFISNKDERDKLTSSDYQRQIADSLADGVMLFLSERQGMPPVAPNATSRGSSSGSGTISTAAPSAREQSLTQNLHSPKAKQMAEKLKFKKRGVAATRSLN